MELIYVLISCCICAAIAHSKGRNAFGWFFMGLFTILGIVIAAVMPNERERLRREEAAKAETRRLREQLRQERMKGEAFRQHAAARLDVHDQHLGTDTRQITALPSSYAGQAPLHLAEGEGEDEGTALVEPSPPGRAQDAAAPAREWYYELEGKSRGPVSAEAIRAGLAHGKLDGASLIWREGMSDWQAASAVTAFASSFR